jgi:hypothetical protein
MSFKAAILEKVMWDFNAILSDGSIHFLLRNYDILLRSLLIGMLVLICLPMGSQSIWNLFDDAAYGIINIVSRKLRDGSSINETRWRASVKERNFIFRLGAVGLILVFAFPLHSHFGTATIIDGVWRFGEFCKHISQHIVMLPRQYYSANDWRGEEYELWEVCVFIWTVLFIGLHQGKDILTYLKATGGKGTAGYVLGYLHLISLTMFMLFGVVTLLVFAVSLFRVLFEFAVILFLTVAESLLIRAYYKQKIVREGKHGLEILIYAELPALIAFLVILIFIWDSEGLSSLHTHWSHSFVAGASALDLLFANVSLLAIGLAQSVKEG